MNNDAKDTRVVLQEVIDAAPTFALPARATPWFIDQVEVVGCGPASRPGNIAQWWGMAGIVCSAASVAASALGPFSRHPLRARWALSGAALSA